MFHYRLIYSLALLIFFPIIIIYLIILALKDNELYSIKDRFGINLILKNENGVCVHCASLGEINGAKRLIGEIKKNNTTLISTNTFSGKKRAKELFPDLDVIYFPLDYVIFVKNWLKFLNIQSMIIYETEVWPNFYKICSNKNIKIAIVNARVKKDSYKKIIVKKLYSEALKNCDLILCKSEYERQKYLNFNINEKNLLTAGNLKYSYNASHSDEENPVGIKKYFLMASTHDPDEANFSRAILDLVNNRFTTVIAPRHIERSVKIFRYFQLKGVTPYLYSDLNRDKNLKVQDGSILIIDKFGVLSKFYKEAKFVYVGGGFSKRGIQNIIEPSSHGKTILVGPNIDNFYEEVKNLEELKCATIISQKKSQEDECHRQTKIFYAMDSKVQEKNGEIGKKYNMKFHKIVTEYIKILQTKKIIN